MNKNTIIKLLTSTTLLVMLYSASVNAGDFKYTSNELAAKGPIPGYVSLYAKELKCSQKLKTPGYYPSLNGAEISDSERSGVFPCATFTGSWDGPNQVYAYRADGDYQGISYMNNREPGELYIVGGEYPTPDDPLPAGPYVAKLDATTGHEIWRTYVDNQNISHRWIGNSNLNILENGNIVQAWSNQIVLIDGDTGRILKHNTLPTGDAPAEDVNYKHVTVAPDGTLILKHQSRPIGCKIPGTMGIIKCSAQGMKMPNSTMAAVDPDTLEVLDWVALPEPAASPHAITMFEGKIAIYVGMAKTAQRYFWDPKKKLSLDKDWVIPTPVQKGQTLLTAPSIVGDWVAFQTNGLFTNKKASSIVVTSQKDPKNRHVIFPFGKLKPGQFSFAPPKAGADPENNMIYSADMGVGKVAGIKINPRANSRWPSS